MELTFNKLVRDNIPQKIENNGEQAITRVLTESEFKIELYKKLEEEQKEVVKSKNKEELIEELADLSEVIYSIMLVNNITQEEVEQARIKKQNKN